MALCGAAWFLYPQIGWFPLIPAALPWVFRFLSGRSPLNRTRFDLALLVFLALSAVGVWAAYNQQAAWEKFWVIVGAILLFYALARQPRENTWAAIGFFSLLGFILALSFLFGHDWQAQPTGIGIIDRLGERWMTLRPDLGISSLAPNQAGGLLAMQLPLAIGLTLRSWIGSGKENIWSKDLLFQSSVPVKWLAPILAGVIGAGLLMTSSRGAMLAVLVSSGLWGLWWLSGYLTRKSSAALSLRALAFTSCIVAALALMLAFTASSGGPVELANFLPGEPSGGSRVTLAQDATQLIGDFWITGAGLGAFGGMYSQYIKGIPFFFFEYSHNYYLDVAFEEGLLGFLALIFILVVSLTLLGRRMHLEGYNTSYQLIYGAIIASLLAVVLHGFVDDALFLSHGTPYLFLLAGLVAAVVRTSPYGGEGESIVARTKTLRLPVREREIPKVTGKIAIGYFLILGLILAFVWWREPLAASLYANLGALEMARVELADFPSGKWDDGRNVTALEPAERYFELALEFDPTNRTAQHRLGLIAALRGDYPLAVEFLEKAYLQAPKHQGIRKALGYSYVWSGEHKKASLLFRDLPETRQELQVYIGWWANHDREDLSQQAKLMSAFLEGGSE